MTDGLLMEHQFAAMMEVIKAYNPQIRYNHPQGAQKWVKNVVTLK